MDPNAVKFPKDSVLPPIRRKEETRRDDKSENQDEVSYSSKLTNVEAQRIMSVIQDIQIKINIINMLTDSTDRRPATIFNMDTLSSIKNYWDAELKYKTCSETVDTGKAYQVRVKHDRIRPK